MRLAELQERMACALVQGTPLPTDLMAPAAISASRALAAHRDTVLGGLRRALAITYPTVTGLLGETEFDAAATAYAARCPPRQANLAAYGDSFADFLDDAASPPCLPDVARLDLAIERAAASPRLGRILPLDEQVSLSLPVSLRLLGLAFPADEIRDAVEAGDDDALAVLSSRPRERQLAVWRSGDGAGVRALSLPATTFLEALLEGRSADAALNAANASAPADVALLAIQSEVFAASFAAVFPTTPEEAPP